MTQNDTALARQFFIDEIARNRKATRTGIIVGGVIGLILIAYFVIMLNMVNEITNPKNLAEFVHNQAVLTLPAAKRDMAGALKAAAPEVIRGVMEQVVAIFPEMRQFAETELKKITNEALTTARAELDGVYVEVLKAAKARVLELEAAGEHPNSQIFLDELKLAINKQIANKITDKPEESLFAQLDQTYVQLVSIEKKLRALANDKDPDRSEVLEKRLIQSWMLLVEDAVTDVDSEDVGNVKTNLPKKGAEPAPAQ